MEQFKKPKGARKGEEGMKKRILGIAAVAAALVLALGVLAGCGGSGSSSAASGSGSGSASAASSASGSGSGAVYRTLDDIKASGTLVVGVFSDKNPFGYVDENGEYAGYDVELANRLAKELGVAIEYVSTEAASRVEFLQTGKVDIILANFTVTPERAEQVDFADPYMNVALGVVSHNDRVIKSLDELGADDQVIVITGTTAETYLTKNYPNIKLQKYDTYASAKTAFENKNGVAWANDNTEVIAFANQTQGYTVGIEELGDLDTIAPAVSKGNETLLAWINETMAKLGSEKFFHTDYQKTLLDVYGAAYEDTLVVEPGQAAAAAA